MQKKSINQRLRLQDIRHAIANLNNLDDVFNHIVESAVFLIGCEEATIFFIDIKTNELYARAQVEKRKGKAKSIRLKVSDSIIGSVIRNKKPLNLSAKEIKFSTGQLVNGLLCVPLISKKKTIGALCAYNIFSGIAFTKEDEYTLTVLANLSAIAIENANNLENARKREIISTQLIKINNSLLSIKEYVKSIKLITNSVRKILEADLVILYVYEERKGGFEYPPFSSGVSIYPNRIKNIREDGNRESLMMEILHLKEPFFAPNGRNDWKNKGFYPTSSKSDVDNFFLREKIESSIGIPLSVNAEPIGVMFINFRSHRDFTNEDEYAIELFSNQAALAIHNSRVVRLQEQMLQALTILNKIGTKLSSLNTVDIEKILKLVYRQTSKLIDVSNFYIALYDGEKEEVQFKYVIEDGKPQRTDMGDWESRVRGKGLTEYLINTKKPLLISNQVDKWIEDNGLEKIGRQAMSWLGVPMITKGIVFGVIVVQDYKQQNAINEFHLQLVSTIATQAAIAIEKAHLLLEEKRKIEIFNAIHGSSLNIAAPKTLPARLNAIVYEASRLLNAKGGKIYLKIPGIDKLQLETIIGVDDTIYPPKSTMDINLGMAGEVFRTKKPIIVDEYSKYPEHIKELDGIFESVIEVPLELDNEIIGVLGVFDDKLVKRFSKDDIPILKEFALHASLAIRDAKLIEHERSRVRDLEILNLFAESFSKKIDKNELLSEIAQVVTLRLQCTHCTIFILNGNIWDPIHTFSQTGKKTVTRQFMRDDGLLGFVYRRGKSMLFADAASHESFADATDYDGYHERSMLIVPIKVGERIIGMISTDKDQIGAFNENDLRLIDSLALHAGIAYERAVGLELLHRTGNILINTISTEDVEHILKQVLEGAINLANATSGIIYLFDKTLTTITHTYKYPPDAFHPTPRRDKRGGLLA